ncbi:Hypothetical protein CINCED_3A025128 [Cinara cedri]|uniref:Uncharacterized protein n=1 Tax=Cinara cedri TaxID=506608 RepID=A0A5E4MGN9_9HEMI|nr:Hypothetical protein CINCED_3A011284 [Cinara cedri]VVC29553.1 Hypothetical protein CINCED_3A025128 [Cinara cedri]
MADTNAVKKFIYIAPTPPADLIDSTSFTIDFAGRKFLHVGLDPRINSPPSPQLPTLRYTPISSSFSTPRIEKERGVDQNDEPYGPQYSMILNDDGDDDEEEYNIHKYCLY